ncbi:Lrp/AsnC family transcriptional regulator [Streptomyces flavofungini]|uniref:Lrp/AsnC family transcriptional regulator n=1 Tax=Streptomyces flavofungini TaxID=68200 RepID=UPI0034DFCA2B
MRLTSRKAGKLQESSASRGFTPDSDSEFSELDLALVDALQSAPRASWTQLGRALDIDATTASRRWERLRSEGLAWVTAYERPDAATVAFVEVRCSPRQFDAVSHALTQLPWVISVEEMAGDFDLLLAVTAADLHSLGRAVHGTVGGLRGVRSTQTRLGLTVFSEGGDWRTHAIPSVSRALLPESGTTTRFTYSTHVHTRRTPHDQSLRAALGNDGRMSYKDLGAAIGVSEYTARRRLLRMLREQKITLRCDLAHQLAGYRTVVLYRAAVPHQHLEHTGAALARLDQVRLAISVSGPHNLLVMAWLHDLNGISPFETLLTERFPHLQVHDRAIALHTPKRMGWLLDPDGRARRYVPLALPEPTR